MDQGRERSGQVQALVLGQAEEREHLGVGLSAILERMPDERALLRGLQRENEPLLVLLERLLGVLLRSDVLDGTVESHGARGVAGERRAASDVHPTLAVRADDADLLAQVGSLSALRQAATASA